MHCFTETFNKEENALFYFHYSWNVLVLCYNNILRHLPFIRLMQVRGCVRTGSHTCIPTRYWSPRPDPAPWSPHHLQRKSQPGNWSDPERRRLHPLMNQSVSGKHSRIHYVSWPFCNNFRRYPLKVVNSEF